MKLVGLNGTTIWPISNGRIDRYFTEGIFPYQWTWRKSQWHKALAQVPNEPYLLTGFSAGGTLCHNIANIDYNCKGVMIHSGQFVPPEITRPDLPILLLRTRHDFFDTYKETGEAYDWYNNNNYTNVDIFTLSPTTRFAHEYANGLSCMRFWSHKHLDYNLPLKGTL